MSLLQPSLDQVTTINEDGSRNFIYPADVRGWFQRMRGASAWMLIAVYALLPWIPVNGNPAVFLDVQKNQFHFFGLTLVGQDLWLGFFAITGLGFSLFFLTSLVGRVWCGWACPQTVFIEHVFRRIERWIEGDATERRRLEAAPWTREKWVKRGVKHFLFVLGAFLISHLFLSYFISLPRLYQIMHASPLENFGIFVFVIVLTGILYFNFAWFREQFCIVLCPYGRLQSALLDDHSVVIGYDRKRGEPRGKAGDSGVGDCVDCRCCVQVCPTGIDIRQGLQMECISCANCIDACDEVMLKLNRPRGLVRYDSMSGLSGGKTRWIRPRTLVYSGFLLVGLLVASVAASTFRPITVSALRMTGAPYYLTETQVRNQYLIRLINKKNEPLTCRVEVESDGPAIEVAGVDGDVIIAPLGQEMRGLVVTTARSEFKGEFPVRLRIRAAESTVLKVVPFLGPGEHQ